jgi:hypothetical protein
MIAKFDPATCKKVAAEMMTALEAVGKKHGLIFERGSARYDADHFTMPITAKVTGGGTVEDVQRREFEKHCTLYDCKPTDYGKTFTNRGETFKIVGFDNRRPKFCIKCERVSDGSSTSFPDAVLAKIRA